MGLPYLEWHKHGHGWVARMVIPFDTNPGRNKFRRYAHVNLFSWDVKRRTGKVPVQFQFYKQGYDVSWHDTIEDAKLHVEAIFALDDDID